VLVIEDDPDLRAMLIALLEEEGYAVTATDASPEALALARRLRPSVILLDLGVPEWSGGPLLTQLRADPGTAAIPLVALSGLPWSVTAEQRALATDVVAKPFELQALLDVIRPLGRRRRARRRPTRRGSPP
jgi:two-component system, OmpR family, response regulator